MRTPKLILAVLLSLGVASAASAGTLDIQYEVVGGAIVAPGDELLLAGTVTLRFTAIDATTIAPGTQPAAFRTLALTLHTTGSSTFGLNLLNTLPGSQYPLGASAIGVYGSGSGQLSVAGVATPFTLPMLAFAAVSAPDAEYGKFLFALASGTTGDGGAGEKLAFAIAEGKEINRNFSPTIPEPGALLLFGLGAAVVVSVVRRPSR